MVIRSVVVFLHNTINDATKTTWAIITMVNHRLCRQ